MNVYLRDGGDLLPSDIMLNWTGRSDLVPVPRSLEFTCKIIDGVQQKLVKGVSVWAGRENLAYEVVKVDRAPALGQIQGKDQQQAMKVTALLKSCAGIARAVSSAVVSYGNTFGGLYRACGAYTDVANDFVVPRFACFRGRTPSYALAQVLQEEGAALVLRGKAIHAMRLTDMSKQAPIDDLGAVDSSAKISSEFLELQDVPSYYTLDDAGAVVTGQMGQNRCIAYMPRGDVRQLRNASSVIIRSRTIDSAICQHVNAGDVLRVAGENLVVITAAHSFDNSDDGQQSRSRLWVGSLVNAL